MTMGLLPFPMVMPHGQGTLSPGISACYQASMSAAEAGKYEFKSQLGEIFNSSELPMPCLERGIVEL